MLIKELEFSFWIICFILSFSDFSTWSMCVHVFYTSMSIMCCVFYKAYLKIRFLKIFVFYFGGWGA